MCYLRVPGICLVSFLTPECIAEGGYIHLSVK